jgi:hypothetical protein
MELLVIVLLICISSLLMAYVLQFRVVVVIQQPPEGTYLRADTLAGDTLIVPPPKPIAPVPARESFPSDPSKTRLGDTLVSGSEMHVGDALVSNNKKYTAILEKSRIALYSQTAHGELVLMWSASGGTRLVLQESDGDVVLYDDRNRRGWSLTHGHGGRDFKQIRQEIRNGISNSFAVRRFVLEDDGHLRLYDSNGVKLWETMGFSCQCFVCQESAPALMPLLTLAAGSTPSEVATGSSPLSCCKDHTYYASTACHAGDGVVGCTWMNTKRSAICGESVAQGWTIQNGNGCSIRGTSYHCNYQSFVDRGTDLYLCCTPC